MRSRRRLILLAAGIALLHFLATWCLTLQSWTDDSAGKVLAVMSFPGRFVSFYISGVSEKLQNMVLMLANSVLWGLVLTTLVVLARWSFRRKV